MIITSPGREGYHLKGEAMGGKPGRGRRADSDGKESIIKRNEAEGEYTGM